MKKKKSTHVLNNSSSTSAAVPLPGTVAAVNGFGALHHHSNRASWCSGERLPQGVVREVQTVEDAKGAIERWRGRWGSMQISSGVNGDEGRSSRTGSRAVAAEESEDEDDVTKPNGTNAHQFRDATDANLESIPAGLVLAAADNLNPRTPPQRIGSLENENDGSSRSGSPTPKGKPKGITKMRETEEQRRKREEDQLKTQEEARERIRMDLIKQEEKERMLLVAKEKNDTKKGARSRSRSKLRRKGKGKK